MTRHRLLPFLTIGALALAACGGADSADDPAVGTSPARDATDTAEPVDDSAADTGSAEPDSGPDDPGGAIAPLTALWSAPAGGTALGATVAISPDGGEVALMTGGIEPALQIHDATNGELLRSTAYHGQGLELAWTTSGQLVSWDAERLHQVDASTLEYPGGVDLAIGPGAEECPNSVFDVEFDRGADALFIADFHPDGVIVCRLDVAAASIAARVLEFDEGGSGRAFFRPESGEVIVSYNDPLGTISSYSVLDAATLDVISTEASPTGEPIEAATATDLVVGLEQFVDAFAATSTPIAAPATGDRFGNRLFGTEGGQLIVMDATTGAAQLAGSEAFRPLDATADGSRLVVLLQEAIEVYDLG